MLRSTLLCLLSFLSIAQAEVRINELSARSSERVIRWFEESPPVVGSGAPWWSLSFNDEHWTTQSGPFSQGVPAQSIYVRKNFNFVDGAASSSASVDLTINYDDGFVAFLNGVEVARRNMGTTGAFNYHDQPAYNNRGNRTETITLGTVADLILTGDNILAVQVHSHTANSTIRFAAGLALGNSSIVSNNETFKIFTGFTEPSGGVFDPGLLPNASFDRGFADWIELYNSGPQAVDLTDWSLQNDSAWTFPAGTTIPANDYLLILADGLGTATQPPGATYLHTDFRLSGSGENLTLLNASGTPVSGPPSDYPEQDLFHSYGLPPGSTDYAFLSQPTPGGPNFGPGLSGIVKSPKFDQPGGFHDNAISLNLTSNTEGAAIFFTTDGSAPTPLNGTLIQTGFPISIAKVAGNIGTVIRARAFKNGMIPSPIKTRTFLIDQDPALQTLPAVSVAGNEQQALYQPHGITSIVGGTRNGSGVWQVSNTANDYNIPIQFGRHTERKASLEFRHPDGSDGFQTDVAIRIAGSRGHGRPRLVLQRTDEVPWPTGCFPGTSVGFSEKPSFNFFFRGDFGDSRLDYPMFPGQRVTSFESIRARAGKNDVHTPFIRDEFARRLFKDMGQITASGNLSTLYVNGEYKGYYNLTERYKPAFFESWFDAGPDWDIRDRDGVTDGDNTAYNQLATDAAKNLTIPANYQAVAEQLDLVNYADYLILNIYGSSIDWVWNNYFMARERVPDTKFIFALWDSESMFGHRGAQPVTYDMFSPGARLNQTASNRPIANFWAALKTNEEFRLLFADRLQKHFFTPGGALTKENLLRHFESLREEIEPTMAYTINETVEESSNSGCVTDLRAWIETREGILFGTGANPAQKHFIDAGVWPEIEAPVFSQNGGIIPTGASLRISAGSGTTYYTTNGSDPRLTGGNANPSASNFTASGSSNATLVSLEENGWRYLDTGVAQSDSDIVPGHPNWGTTDWKHPDFDDSTWGTGQALLGYGGISGRTLNTTIGPISPPRHPTLYFRKPFTASGADGFTELTLSSIRDDGAIYYLNGKELTRSNLPDGNTQYHDLTTTGTTSEGDLRNLGTFTLSPGDLIEGTNVLSVELHQRSQTDSDAAIDAQITALQLSGGTVNLTQTGTVKARTLHNGEWSALTEASFIVGTPASSANLAVTEIYYNPPGPDEDTEFLELMNLDPVSSIDLTGVTLTGITYAFPSGFTLAPLERVIIVKNQTAFDEAFDTAGLNIAPGNFAPTSLNNGGEEIAIIAYDGLTDITRFNYSDDSPWPTAADGDGFSLVLISPLQNLPPGASTSWRASTTPGGNPGTSDASPPFTGDPDADQDQDGLSALLEHLLASSDTEPNAEPPLAISFQQFDGNTYLTTTLRHDPAADDVSFQLESATDLQDWTTLKTTLINATPNEDGTVTSTFRSLTPTGSRQFLRLKATAR